MHVYLKNLEKLYSLNNPDSIPEQHSIARISDTVPQPMLIIGKARPDFKS